MTMSRTNCRRSFSSRGRFFGAVPDELPQASFSSRVFLPPK